MNNIDSQSKFLAELQLYNPHELPQINENEVNKIGESSHNLIERLFWRAIGLIFKRFQTHFKERGYKVIEQSNLHFLKEKFGIQSQSLSPEEKELIHVTLKDQFIVKNWRLFQTLHRQEAIFKIRNDNKLVEVIEKGKPKIAESLRQILKKFDEKKSDKIDDKNAEILITLYRTQFCDNSDAKVTHAEFISIIDHVVNRHDVQNLEELLIGVEERILYKKLGKDSLSKNETKQLLRLFDPQNIYNETDLKEALDLTHIEQSSKHKKDMAPEDFLESTHAFLKVLNSLKNNPQKDEILDAIRHQSALREIITENPKLFIQDLKKLNKNAFNITSFIQHYNKLTLENYVQRANKDWNPKIRKFLSNYFDKYLGEDTKLGKCFYQEDPAIKNGGLIYNAVEIFDVLKSYKNIAKIEDLIENGLSKIGHLNSQEASQKIVEIKTKALHKAKRDLWVAKTRASYSKKIIDHLTNWSEKVSKSEDSIQHVLMVERISNTLLQIQESANWLKANNQYINGSILEFLEKSATVKEFENHIHGLLSNLQSEKVVFEKYFDHMNRLNNDVAEMNLLASLQIGDLLKSTSKGLTKIPPPRGKIQQIISLIRQLGQHRSTDEALNEVQRVIKSIKNHIESMNRIEMPVDPSREIYTLMRLENALTNILTANSGLLALKKTLKLKKGHQIFSIYSLETEIQDQIKPLITARLKGLMNTKQYLKTVSEQPDELKALFGSIVVADLKLTENDSLKSNMDSPWHIQLFSRDLVINSLNDIFGKDCSNEVIKFYGLDRAEDTPALSRNDVHALIIGMIANLTSVDIEKMILIDNIFTKNIPQERLKYFRDLLSVKSNATGKLSDQDLVEILDIFQKVNLGELATATKDLNYKDQLLKDLNFLKVCKRVSAYKDLNDDHLNDIKKFNYFEFLARDIIYNLYDNPRGFSDNSNVKFRDGVIFPAYDSQKEVMTCKQAFSVYGNKGLFAALIAPAVKNMGSSDPVDVQVVFRGTYDYNSIVRDGNLYEKQFFMEQEGPGGKSFELGKREILNTIDHLLRKLNIQLGFKTVNLAFTGHSLGACDSQRICLAYTEELNKNNHVRQSMRSTSNFQIKNINVYAFNSPGIEYTLNKRWMDLINSTNSLGQIKFLLRYFKTDGDIVQKGGGVMLGYREAKAIKPTNVDSTVFKFVHARRASNPISSFFKRMRARLEIRYDNHIRYCMTAENAKTTYLADVRTTCLDDSKIRKGNHQLVTTPFDDREYDIARQALLTGLLTSNLNRNY